MWKMFDDIIECNECGGLLGPPPKFLIPPPPRPPSMGSLSNCNEEEIALRAQKAWDSDMCEAMPILDASLYSSQSLQTSAMIAVFSLLLVLVVLLSSLFVWKNKRKVQNFLPCKTPTRGPHLNGGLPIVGAHSVTYEDPDSHLGHRRPLVMRHHHNVEMLHGSKSIHYPSGYPMTRSPPFLVSSSPGPDPYRSNDNVYEELGPGRDSDGDSEGPMHSDDDFAEDELSLPGERSFNKSAALPDASSTVPASISHQERDRANNGNGPSSSSIGPERHSVLSSSSSTQDASTATAASSTSSHNNNNSSNFSGSGNLASGCTAAPARTSLFAGMLRHTTGRSKFHPTNGARAKIDCSTANAASLDDCLNTSSSNTDATDLTPIQQMYDKRSNLMSLAHVPQHHQQQQQQQQKASHKYNSLHHHSLHHPRFRQSNQLSNNNVRSTAAQFYNTLESEVERRNRINAQLSHAPAVATIFRERIHYPSSGRYPQPYYSSNTGNGLLANATGSRTNPRPIDRGQRIAAPVDVIESAYSYVEPLYQENYHYDTCEPATAVQQRLDYPPTYIVPDYISAGGSIGYRHGHHPHSVSNTYQNPTQLYGRGDSSFGSDSGYSHHTPASSIGRHDYDVALPTSTATTTVTPKTPSKLSAALSFTGWNRRKSNAATHTPTSLNVQQSSSTPSSGSGAEATSPNNNSASSTVTSILESSSASNGDTTVAFTTPASNNNNNHISASQIQVQAAL